MRFEAQTTLTFFPHIVIMSVIAYFTFKYFKPNSKQASPLIVPRSIDELAGSHATICTTDRCTIITKSNRSSLTRTTRYLLDDGRLIVVNGSGDVGKYAPEVARVSLEKHEKEAITACETAMKDAHAVAKQTLLIPRLAMSSLTENHKAGMQVKVHEAGIWYYGRLGSNRQVTSKGSTTERGVFFLDKNGEETMAFVDVRLIIDDTENKAMSLAPPSKQQEV